MVRSTAVIWDLNLRGIAVRMNDLRNDVCSFEKCFYSCEYFEKAEGAVEGTGYSESTVDISSGSANDI